MSGRSPSRDLPNDCCLRAFGGRGLSPAPDRDAGPEAKEVPCGDEGRSDGAVRVLKHDDQRRRQPRLEQA